MEKDTYIIAEGGKGSIPAETLELVTFAGELSPGKRPTIVLLGRDIAGPARDLAARTGCDIIAVMGENLELYNADTYRQALLDLLLPLAPAWVCLPHTAMGYDLAPGLSVGLKAACITGVEAVHDRTFTRSAYGGKFLVDITPARTSAVLTVLPGSFSPCRDFCGPAGRVTSVECSGSSPRSLTLGIKESTHRDSALKDAEVIVSAGRGIGKREQVALLKRLASLFPRSAVGASRSVCDLGWLDYRHQIGTTGQTVSPKLYIACGISGAIQHVSGMKGSQTIVAINTDPSASIFRIAHYCVVEDLAAFIPLLIEESGVLLP